MKICFLLQRRFAYIGHAMALIFKEKYGVNDFCGYVCLRSSFEFLKSQKEINYTKLILDEDLHNQYLKEPLDANYINQLEKEYGLPNLWAYIEPDRFLRRGQHVREYPYDQPKYSHEEMMRIIQVKTKAILKFLKEEKPDLLFLTAITDVGLLFLYNAAKKKNIRVFHLQSSRIGNLHSLTEDYNTLSFVESTFQKIQKNELSFPREKTLAENFLKNFRARPTPHSYTDTVQNKPVTRGRQFKFLRPDKAAVSSKWMLRVFIDYFRNKHKEDPYLIKPWHYVLDRFKRKMRVLRGFDDLYAEPNFSESYAFFPLQLEPEMATSVLAQFYTDQLWLAKQVARSLPITFKLYVKEHPAMYGFRARKFYKELKKIPNVKIIRPTEIGFNLIQNAKLIVTLTGSSGWEGVLFKKPVITFGNVFYNKLPMVKKCENINDLPYLIKKQLDGFTYDEKTLLDFITAIYKESVDLDLLKMWDVEGGSQVEKHRGELTALVDLIAKKANLC